jgi:hypothetical protein
MSAASKTDKQFQYIFLFVLFIGVSGIYCGEEPQAFIPVMPSQRVQQFARDFETVWGALVTILEIKDIDIEAIDKEKGSIITDYIPFDPKSEFGRSATFPEKGERMIDKAKYDMVIAVKPLGEDQTSVELIVHLSKYSRSMMSYYSWKDQLSSGFIEKQLFEELEKMVR